MVLPQGTHFSFEVDLSEVVLHSKLIAVRTIYYNLVSSQIPQDPLITVILPCWTRGRLVIDEQCGSSFSFRTATICFHSRLRPQWYIALLKLRRANHHHCSGYWHSTKTVFPRPVGDAVVFLQHTVVPGDGFGEVCHKRDFHVTQTSLLPRGVDPVENKYNNINGISKFYGHTKSTRQDSITLTPDALFFKRARIQLAWRARAEAVTSGLIKTMQSSTVTGDKLCCFRSPKNCFSKRSSKKLQTYNVLISVI